MRKTYISKLISIKSEALTEYQDRIFKIYIHESITSNKANIKFRNTIFILHVCNDFLLYLTQTCQKTIESKILLNLISYIEKKTLSIITPNVRSDPYINQLFEQTEINIKQIRSLFIATPPNIYIQNTQSDVLDIIKRYKIAAIDGINAKSVLEDLEQAMLNKVTHYLSIENRQYVIEQLCLIYPLWEISHNNSYTKERLIYWSNILQTSNEADLALHEILEKMVKTSTAYQLLVTLNHLCNKMDDTTLALILQHSNLQLLQQVLPSLKKPYAERVKVVQKNVISNRATEIYIIEDLPKIDSETIINYHKTIESVDENMIYQFCYNDPCYDAIKKMYIYAIAESNNLINILIAHSTANQLEIAYDTIVLTNLSQSNDNEKSELSKALALSLGYKIYHEIKYRINHGMILAIYGKDVDKITQMWKDRFAYFDKTLCILQDRIISDILLTLVPYDKIS